MHFNSVLVYTIIMKRYVTYPDQIEKFRSPAHTIKKRNKIIVSIRVLLNMRLVVNLIVSEPNISYKPFCGIYHPLNLGEQIHLTPYKLNTPRSPR